jgi:hypothetical protein
VAVLALLIVATMDINSQQLPATPSTSYRPPQLDFRPAGRAGWLFAPYRPPLVRASSTQDSELLTTLTRDGKVTLTLQDAIELAVEDNFDVELQRYDLAFAVTELLRARGGGLLRGMPTTIAELPSGEGGPGEPLLTTVGGYSPVLQLPSSAADLATITGTQSDLSILSATPFSTGPVVPQFDPAVSANIALTRMDFPQQMRFLQGQTITRAIPSEVGRRIARGSQVVRPLPRR